MACVPLIAVGSVVQGGGFFIALREAAATRREEVPDETSLPSQAWESLLRRVEPVLVRLKLRQPTTRTAELAGTIAIKTNFSGRASFRRGGLPVDQRFDELEEEVQEHRAKQRQEHAALESRIDEVDASVPAEAARLEDARKQRLKRSLFREEAGVLAFVLGLLFTTVGAIV